jgi:hypothetical protein
VNGATMYDFEITDISTSTVVSTQTRTNVNLFFNSVVPALVNTKQYSIRVRANISGVLGTYGSACTIGFASGTREGLEEMAQQNETFDESRFDLKVYPNPFNEQSSIFIYSTNTDKVQVQIFDITGKMLWDEQVNTNENIVIGQEFALGNYIIRAYFSDGTTQIERLIKAE